MLVAAIVLITLALIFYTVGVWAERRSGVLRSWHVACFGLGLACDLSGTAVMTVIASSGQSTTGNTVLGVVMAITGTLALLLMAVHFVWAAIVMIRNRPSEKTSFHRYSVVVWSIWLVPYLSGMIGSMI